jgi:hypothetical protein
MESRTWMWMTSASLFAVLALTIVFTLTPSAEAQTFSVLHNFTGELDGKQPVTGLTIDRAGNPYGTAELGGPCCPEVDQYLDQQLWTV